MSIRQTLNDNPAITTAVTGVIIVVALGVAFRSACSGPGRADTAGSGKLFFTVDDGKTWFADDAGKVPPFEHQGKTAYLVRVFRCPDGKEFASHLERYPEADRKRLQEQRDKARAGGPEAGPGPMFGYVQTMEVKKPGEKEWVKMGPKTMELYNTIMTPTCADGNAEGIMQVLPR